MFCVKERDDFWHEISYILLNNLIYLFNFIYLINEINQLIWIFLKIRATICENISFNICLTNYKREVYGHTTVCLHLYE